jgi:iron complex outermembrane receptor protein
LISLTEKFKVLTGIRWSWQEAQVETTDLIKKTSIEDNEKRPRLHPKLGLVYQPTKDLSVFASYANSFTQILEQQ